jgi:hypothetical protein
MFTVYNYAAGATQANVLSDIVKLLTGETNKANLSAACVQANTSILSTVAAGWSVWDASAGTNIQCLRAINQDASTYKYYLLQFGSTTAFSAATAESWNAGTHTGTNVTPYAANTWDSAGGGYFYIYATSKNIVILPWTSTGYKGIVGSLFEFTREATPATYPTAVVVSGTGFCNPSGATSGYSPRIKSPLGAGDYTSTNYVHMGALAPLPSCVQNLNNTGSASYRDSTEAVIISAYRFGAGFYIPWDGSFVRGGYLLGLSQDVYVTNNNLSSTLDEIVYNSKNYIIVPLTNCSLLFPKE